MTKIGKLLEKSANSDAIVIWIDGDYKRFTKIFKINPEGAADNAIIKARAFADKLNKEDKYRSVDVKYLSEVD
jgi:hypothetical protein